MLLCSQPTLHDATSPLPPASATPIAAATTLNTLDEFDLFSDEREALAKYSVYQEELSQVLTIAKHPFGKSAIDAD
ncbi:hypothetical protein [Nitrosomonas sp. Nm34]|uniref:hypothetical protein n=1 Tax=Nitrosomonas sp. Nm34 TaxID=1881055 RepID=UPI001113A180|nr:hypothetical protein [Nitrosomonas sp. Nm34]